MQKPVPNVIMVFSFLALISAIEIAPDAQKDNKSRTCNFGAIMSTYYKLEATNYEKQDPEPSVANHCSNMSQSCCTEDLFKILNTDKVKEDEENLKQNLLTIDEIATFIKQKGVPAITESFKNLDADELNTCFDKNSLDLVTKEKDNLIVLADNVLKHSKDSLPAIERLRINYGCFACDARYGEIVAKMDKGDIDFSEISEFVAESSVKDYFKLSHTMNQMNANINKIAAVVAVYTCARNKQEGITNYGMFEYEEYTKYVDAGNKSLECLNKLDSYKDDAGCTDILKNMFKDASNNSNSNFTNIMVFTNYVNSDESSEGKEPAQKLLDEGKSETDSVEDNIISQEPDTKEDKMESNTESSELKDDSQDQNSTTHAQAKEESSENKPLLANSATKDTSNVLTDEDVKKAEDNESSKDFGMTLWIVGIVALALVAGVIVVVKLF